MNKTNNVRSIEFRSFGLLLALAGSLAFSATDAGAQQISAYGGLGLNYYRANSITDFLNSNGIGSISPGGFTTAIDFFVGGDLAVTRNWEIGLEYAYLLNSFGGTNSLGSQQVGLSYSLPSLTLHRLIRGEGYVIRFGGGLGYHFGTIGISSPYSNQTQNFTRAGFGFKLDGSIDTKLDEKLYARVGVHALAEFIGQPKDASGTGLTYTDYNSGTQAPVDMNLLGAGISLGLVYYF
jgi:hypothetical protein